MGKLSLKGTVLLTVAVVVVCSCLLTAFVATHRYSQSLEEALAVHARSLAQSLSGTITEMVLINDMVGVQRLLDGQFQGDMMQGYALLVHKGRVLAHTMDAGVPAELRAFSTDVKKKAASAVDSGHVGSASGAGSASGVGTASGPVSAPTSDTPPTSGTDLDETDTPTARKVTLADGRGYLEIAWPLLDGHAGLLRMGFSQYDSERRIAALWRETAVLTLLILLLALVAGLLWLRRLGRPLAALVHGIESVGSGNLTARIPVPSQGEVATLARAFNRMSEKLEGSRLSMEAQAAALHRSHRQLKLCNDIVTTFAALDGVEVMALRLLEHLRDLMPASQCLLFLEHDRQSLVVTEGQTCRTLYGSEVWHTALQLLEGRESVFTTSNLREPLVSATVAACPQQMVLCMVHEHSLCGALVLGHAAKDGPEEADINVLALLLHQVAGSLSRALRHEKELRGSLQQQGKRDQFCGLVGRSQCMRDIFRRIEDVALSEATVLITGESGTGKELAAKAVHTLSQRREQPFVVINCAAYPETLLESELFGYEKGAFTGALRQKPGRFEQADGGTVFLDEIGEISPLAQVRLLRVLQTRQFERVGGEQTLSVDVRVLAATNRDLLEEVRAGRFREDLYYRLDVISLSLPPLRERPGDLPLLVRHCLEQWAIRSGRPPCTLSPGALRLLMAYGWPGNVRELENLLEQCATLSRHGAITAENLPERLRAPVAPSPATSLPTLVAQEAATILEALERCAWNRKSAAARLGIGRTTLYAKMKRYDIRPPKAE